MQLHADEYRKYPAVNLSALGIIKDEMDIAHTGEQKITATNEAED